MIYGGGGIGGGEVYIGERSVVRVRWVGQVEQPLCAMQQQQQPWLMTGPRGWMGWGGAWGLAVAIVEMAAVIGFGRRGGATRRRTLRYCS
jgi:hypothetical protein